MSRGIEDASAADSTPATLRSPASTREANWRFAVIVRSAAGEIVGGQHDTVGAETGIDVTALLEALNEEAGDEQDQQRKRDLKRHQGLAERSCATARRLPARSACCGSSRAMYHAGTPAASSVETMPSPMAKASPTRSISV